MKSAAETVWSELIQSLKHRDLSGVTLFTSDAHPGIQKAIKKHYPGVPWQRCQFHFISNVLDKAPQKRHAQLKEKLRTVWMTSNDHQQAKAKLEPLIDWTEEKLPDLSDWLSEHAESTLMVHRPVPKQHRKRLRTTNSVERLQQELKRRSKVVRIFPNPQSCTRLFERCSKKNMKIG